MENRTPFSDLIDRIGLTYVKVAEELEITAPFVSMLASGKATPSLRQALQIDDWARTRGERCATDSWRKALGLQPVVEAVA